MHTMRFWMMISIVLNNSNKNQIEELRQEKEQELEALKEKQKESETTLKSHNRELDVICIELIQELNWVF